MLKKFYILVFMICLQSTICNIYSQPSIQWQWLYPGPYDLDDEGQDICESTDGNFYLVGTSFGFNFFPNFYVIKINPQGQIIWSRAIGGQNGIGSAYAVAPSLGGGCVVTGGAARFLKFNANGDTVVHKFLTGQERSLFDIKRTADNNYITCGRYNINNATIIKFDSLGNVLWENIYPTPYFKQLYAIEEGIDGGYIAVGRNQNFFNDPLKLLIIKVAENGDSLWTKQYGDNITGVSINKLSSNYIISGQRFINKIDINGNQYTSFPIDSIQLSEQVKDFKLLSPNRFVFVTNNYVHAETTYSKLMISDSSGNILKIKKINFSNYVYLNKIQICSNSDMIFMGFAAQYDTSSKWQYYALRSDSLFNFPPVNVIGIEQISSVVPSQFQLHQNYPNPFNPTTKIKFDVPAKGNIQLIVYDISGRQISVLVDEELNAGSYQTDFDGSDYASGIYFVTMLTGTSKFTRKIALIK